MNDLPYSWLCLECPPDARAEFTCDLADGLDLVMAAGERHLAVAHPHRYDDALAAIG